MGPAGDPPSQQARDACDAFTCSFYTRTHSGHTFNASHASPIVVHAGQGLGKGYGVKLKTPGLPALYITHREDQGINIRQGSNLVRLSVAEVEQLAQLIQQGNE